MEALDTTRQALVIAHYRTHHQMQAVVAKAQADDAKRKQRKPPAKPKG